MPITFTCDCGKQLQAEDQYAGRTTRCPACGRELPIPGRADAVRAAGEFPRPAGGSAEVSRRGWDQPDETRDVAAGPPRSSGKAIASLIVGILSLCLPIVVPSIVAIVLGILGLRDVSQGRGRVTGQGFAITGIVLAVIGMILMLPLMLVALLVPAVQRVREAANRVVTQNNMRQIALSMHNYSAVHQQLPPSVVYDKNGKPLYSWRVLLLPDLGENNLYQQFHLDEPWDSPHNKSLLPLMPKVYTSASASTPPTDGKTHFLVFDSPGCAWDSGVEKRRQKPSQSGLKPLVLEPGVTVYQSGSVSRIPATFQDGTSNTILLIEADDGVPWTKPEDLSYSPNGPLPKLGGLHAGNQFLVGMGDATVRPVSRKGLSDASLRAAITANGNDVVGPDWWQ